MHIDITGRQVAVTPALRKFAEEKLHKLERLLDGPLVVHVVLAVEKHRHLAGACLVGDLQVLQCLGDLSH